MAFIESRDGGWVNLDRVAKITKDRDGDHILQDADGEKLGAIFHGQMHALTPVIPASAGLFAIVFYDYRDDDGAPPEDSDLFVENEPILGWRDFGDYREAILLQPLHDYATAFFQVGTQFRSIEYEGVVAADLAEARGIALKRAIARWEDKVRLQKVVG